MKLRSLVLASLLSAPAFAAPPVPELPETPAGLQKKVAAMRKQVAKVSSHCEDTGERNPGEWDERCPSWLARIKKGGEAADWAIYSEILGEGGEPNLLWTASNTRDSLFDGLIARGSKTSVIALVRAVHRVAESGEEGALDHYLTVLGQITGNEPVPNRLSLPLDQGGLEKIAAGWMTWWAENGTRSVAEWRAAGLAIAKERASSESWGERWAAAERLVEADGDKALARKVVTGALESAALAAEYHWRFRTLGYQVGMNQADIDAALAVRRTALIALGDEDAKEEQQQIEAKAAASRLVSQCQEAFYALRLEEGRDACAKAAELDEQNVLARIGLGWAELELGNTDAASQATDTAMELVYEGADDIYEKVNQLRAAVLTVQGEHEEALTVLRGQTPSQEMRSRLALLEGRAAPATWVAYVAPRYFCWKGKGDEAANGYLLRRGFVKPESFTTGFATLPSERRRALEENAKGDCPWKAVVSEVR